MKNAVLAATLALVANVPVLAQFNAVPAAPATGSTTAASALPTPTVVPKTWDFWNPSRDIGRTTKGGLGTDRTRTSTVAGRTPEATYGQVFDICKLNPKLPQCVGLVDACILNPRLPQCQ